MTSAKVSEVLRHFRGAAIGSAVVLLVSFCAYHLHFNLNGTNRRQCAHESKLSFGSCPDSAIFTFPTLGGTIPRSDQKRAIGQSTSDHLSARASLIRSPKETHISEIVRIGSSSCSRFEVAPELIARQTTRVLSSMSEAQCRRTEAERHWLRPPLLQSGTVPAAVYAAIPDWSLSSATRLSEPAGFLLSC